MSPARLPANRPAPIAPLSPRDGSKSGTFSMARNGTFSTAIDSAGEVVASVRPHREERGPENGILSAATGLTLSGSR